MNDVFYMSIKAICVVYLLYRLFVVIRDGLFGLWKRIFVTKTDRIGEWRMMPEHDTDVVGRTQSIYLEDPSIVPIMPVRSEELERTDTPYEEPEISADEVEDTLSGSGETILPDDGELYDDAAIAPDNEFSRGMTFDQISNAVAVITNDINDESKVSEAARTLYEIRNTDMFGFFTEHIANSEIVDNLLCKYIDSDGHALHQSKEMPKDEKLSDFDWGKYI